METGRFTCLAGLMGLLSVVCCGAEETSADVAPHDDAQRAEEHGDTQAATDAPAQIAPGMYNRRYCEVLGVSLDLATMTARADVYNSLPFGACPQAQWEALDAAVLAEQLGVDQVMLNGPRYFVMDSGSGSTLAAGTVETFGEITMALMATVDLDLSEGLPSADSYTLREVVRDNAWFFDAGREIYELVDPDGHTYVMQSYARIVEADLDLADLPTLAEALTLPDGWTYHVRTLVEDLTVQANGIAIVVQDDLMNTYQRSE